QAANDLRDSRRLLVELAQHGFDRRHLLGRTRSRKLARRFRIVGDRGERLVDLVRQRRDKGAELAQAASLQQLGLDGLDSLRPASLLPAPPGAECYAGPGGRFKRRRWGGAGRT